MFARVDREKALDKLVFAPPVLLACALLYLAIGGSPLFGAKDATPPDPLAAVAPLGTAVTTSPPDPTATTDAHVDLVDASALIAPVVSASPGSQSAPAAVGAAVVPSPGLPPELPPPAAHVLPQPVHDAAPTEAAFLESLLSVVLP
jgi:hypothetical protein